MTNVDQLWDYGPLIYASSKEKALIGYQRRISYSNMQHYLTEVMQEDLSTVLPEAYDPRFSLEELNLYYAYLRDHLIGDAYTLFEETDITTLPPTECNLQFSLDPQVEVEQIIEGCLIRSQQLAGGYPDIFKNYASARGVPFLALSQHPMYKSNNWDLSELEGRNGELLHFIDYFKSENEGLKTGLRQVKHVWEKKEESFVSSIAQVVGLDEEDFCKKSKHVLGTRIPWGSYYYYDSSSDKPEYPFVYTKDHYPSFIAIPLEDLGEDSWQAPYVITEELVHLEIAEVADKLPHDIKEAVMTATLTQIFNNAGDTAYTFWMANDWSRRMAGGTYQSLQKYLEPIYQGKSTVQETLSRIYKDNKSGNLYGYVNKT